MEKKFRKIAIDTGKGVTKICIENPKSNTSIRKSFATAFKANEEITEDPNSHILEYGGISYLVGSQAMRSVNRDNSKNNDVHKITAICACALACDNNDKLLVAIGCPLDQYYNKDRRIAYNDELLPEGKYNVIIDGVKKTFEIAKVKVYPESSGAIMKFASEFQDTTVNVVDIGNLNVNACVYDECMLQEASRHTSQTGGLYLCEISLNKLKAAVKGNEVFSTALENSTPESIQNDVKRKLMKTLPASEMIFQSAREQIVEEIYDQLKSKGFNLLNKTMFIGGTSYLLKKEIENKFTKDTCIFPGKTLEDIQFVNAEGFYNCL